MHIPATVKTWKTYACLCGRQEQCLAIVQCFRSINDIRGQYKKAPNVLQGGERNKQATLINFWLKRLCSHFPLAESTLRNELVFKKKNVDGASNQEKSVKITQFYIQPG